MATFTPDDVAGIVREVLRRLAAAPAAPARPAARVPAPQPTPQPAPPSPPSGFAIGEKVVSAATLAAVPPGTRSVRLRADAVVTPSARDAAREAGYELVRGPAGGAAVAAPAAFPFVVATADAGAEAQARAAAISRAVPLARRLPATGLADVAATLALDLPRDGGRALVLAGRPHAAVALANRAPGIRAVTARDTATLLAAAAECAANLVVVAPRDFSAVALERVAVALATRPAGAPPAELAPPDACPCGGPATAACACTSHPH